MTKSDGSPWRPIGHIRDIARAFIAVLGTPRELIHNEAFNVRGCANCTGKKVLSGHRYILYQQ